MTRVTQVLTTATIGATLWGCTGKTPAPPRVPVPAESNRDVMIERDPVKPMPPDSYSTFDMAPTPAPAPQPAPQAPAPLAPPPPPLGPAAPPESPAPPTDATP